MPERYHGGAATADEESVNAYLIRPMMMSVELWKRITLYHLMWFFSEASSTKFGNILCI